MSWTDRWKPKTDAEVQAGPASAPESKPALLRDRLRDKLLALAEANDIGAIRELLNRPDLLDPDPIKGMTYEETHEALMKLIAKGKQRAMAADPYYIRDSFCNAIRQRLEDEGKHELVRRWDSIGQSLRDELWSTILECLSGEEGGADGVLGTNTAVM
jgi:hypothetical protein